MAELLSVEHTILERPFMEFRPFGVDKQGEKIRDISGTIVKANVVYLQEWVSRASGAEAASRTIEELCRLLNERVRDPAYHVTPKFLNNIWNSYSYEFVCYVREFCQRLSADPQFHFNTGRYQHISATTRILGRHLSVAQILSMYAFFVRKYASEDVVKVYVANETDRSINIGLTLTNLAVRQFGPYRNRCAQMVCQSAQGALIGLPERIHGLAPATALHITCMVNGDERCEWEVHWQATTKSWISHIIKRLSAFPRSEKMNS